MNLLRRAVTVPLTTVLMACVLVAAPLLLAISAVVGLATHSSRPIRTVAVMVAYASIELRTLAHLLRGQRDGDQLVRDFLDTAYTGVRRILDVEVVLDSDSAAPELIPRDDPVIVVSRHADPATACWWRGCSLSGTRCGSGGAQGRIKVRAGAGLRGRPGCLSSWPRPCPSADSRYGRVIDRRAGAAHLPRGRQLQLASVARRHRELRSTGRIRAARRAFKQSHTLPPYGRRRCCDKRGTQCECPCAHSQRVLPRWAGTAVVAASDSPTTTRPLGSRPSHPAPRTR